MPHYFLDTSALAKLYRKELESDFVDRIVAEQGSRRLISRFTLLEMESVLPSSSAREKSTNNR